MIPKQYLEVEEIRKQLAIVAHTLAWLQRTGKLFAPNIPDFDSFWNPYLKLLEISKVGLNGKIKKQDKRGAWR